jgi:hypothetical protein
VPSLGAFRGVKMMITVGSSMTASEIREGSLHPRHAALLLALATAGTGGPVRPGQLVGVVNGSAPGVTNGLHQLRKRGLVRTGPDGAAITERGVRALQKARDLSSRLVVEFGAALEAVRG